MTRRVTALAVVTLAIAAPGTPAAGQCNLNELTRLTANDASVEDYYGWAVAVSGETMMVGAINDDDNGSQSGSAYIYHLASDSTSPIQIGKITASDGAAGDEFGSTIGLEGDLAVVGTPKKDDVCPSDPQCQSGAAYVYRYDGANWQQEAKLTADDAGENDWFGISVDIDGGTIVVGAYQDGSSGIGSFDGVGAAYVFEFDGKDWNQVAKLTASDSANGNLFGFDVAIDNDVIIASAHGSFSASGAVYVFERPGSGWTDATQDAKLTASDAAGFDQLGFGLDISGDVIVAGAYRDDDLGADSGSVYVFHRPGANWANMTQTFKLNANDGQSLDFYGLDVGVEDDIIVVGAQGDDDNGAWSGSVYVYLFSGGSWTQNAKFTASDGVIQDRFGECVTIDDGVGVFGAYGDDDSGMTSGAAYVFRGLSDCNDNNELDLCDVSGGFSDDLNNNQMPDECDPPLCPPDLDGDGNVGPADLATLLGAWGDAAHPADLDGNGTVGAEDLAVLLGAWGACS